MPMLPRWGRIQRSPTGLLDFLGMQSSGQQPTVFPESLQGTVDLSPLYLAERQTWSVHSTAAINAIGLWGASGSIVPNGQLWIAQQISCVRTLPLGAGTTLRYRLAIYEANTTTPIAIGPVQDSTAAGEIPYLGWDGPIVIKGGYGIAVVVMGGTFGVPPTLYVSFRGAKLLV